MIKHALNSYLSMNITFINELSDICEKIGANGIELGKLLKLEPRIGKHALLRPGLSFAGGTLARDIVSLLNISNKYNCKSIFLNSIWKSNNERKLYLINYLNEYFGNLNEKKFLILGLTYKPNTTIL